MLTHERREHVNLGEERLEHVNPGEARTCELMRDENM